MVILSRTLQLGLKKLILIRLNAQVLLPTEANVAKIAFQIFYNSCAKSSKYETHGVWRAKRDGMKLYQLTVLVTILKLIMCPLTKRLVCTPNLLGF